MLLLQLIEMILFSIWGNIWETRNRPLQPKSTAKEIAGLLLISSLFNIFQYQINLKLTDLRWESLVNFQFENKCNLKELITKYNATPSNLTKVALKQYFAHQYQNCEYFTMPIVDFNRKID